MEDSGVVGVVGVGGVGDVVGVVGVEGVEGVGGVVGVVGVEGSMINTDRITDAMIATECPALALEEGVRLVDHWINEGVCSDKKIIAVECGFVFWLDTATVIIGVQDLLTDEEGVVGNEWKTTGAASKYWNEAKWYKGIAEGSQVRIYALALNRGIYYSHGESVTPHVERPRICVRAVSKSSPPVIWSGENDGVIEFGADELQRTEAALIAKAATIRAIRKTGREPYQLPGIWCVNQFKRQCEHYSDCVGGTGPAGWAHFDQDDPASKLALPHVGDRINDPDLVVLSASSYAAASECLEKYRRGALGAKEKAMVLDIGTAFHAGVSSWYTQLKESQEK